MKMIFIHNYITSWQEEKFSAQSQTNEVHFVFRPQLTFWNDSKIKETTSVYVD